jgi:hypothetical protein
LVRLDTAFSRDQPYQVYVQDRIKERGGELFVWLNDGAHVYVRGDAKQMAAAVDRALRKLIALHVGLAAMAAIIATFIDPPVGTAENPGYSARVTLTSRGSFSRAFFRKFTNVRGSL